MHCIWFREDLRTIDNTGLIKACEAGVPVVGLYVLTPETWQQHHKAAVQVEFILGALESLKKALARLNIPLKIVNANTFEATPKAIADFCKEHRIQHLFANKQYLLDELERDQVLSEALQKEGVESHFFDDAYLLPPGQVLKNDGTPFKVFTPYKKAFLSQLNEVTILPLPSKMPSCSVKCDELPSSLTGFNSKVDASLWPASEQAALDVLDQFVAEKAARYKDDRDFPHLEGTSKISVYLAQGLLSPRQCVIALCEAFEADLETIQSQKGPECWFSELIWREFYAMIAYQFPQVVKHQPLQAYTDALPWNRDETLFQAWCEGQTGFPFVDAAMRQLNQTGWMHNRLRMVVAMFLTKTLFLDWRLGEQYFMEKLIDGDFASNNGGWQWSASTGTDAAPYFRIFNPITQSEKFDPSGDFIRQYCPELGDMDAKAIHNPNSFERQLAAYPEPVVDYSHMRQVVIEAFKAAKS